MQDRQRNRSAVLLGKAKSCNRTISHVELQVLVDEVWLSTRMTVREYASTFDQILNACSSPPVRKGRLSVTIPKKPNDFTDDASGRQRKNPSLPLHCRSLRAVSSQSQSIWEEVPAIWTKPTQSSGKMPRHDGRHTLTDPAERSTTAQGNDTRDASAR